MTPDEIRTHIDNLLKEKNIPLNSASIQIGKNKAYLHQYINRRSPVRLPEELRKKLAFILNVDEQELTDLPLQPMVPAHLAGIDAATRKISSLFKAPNSLASIDIIDAAACCGNGIEALFENKTGSWEMSMPEFKSISTTSDPRNVKMLRVKGDSMVPTINDGDWVLVDISIKAADTDGLFLLRLSTGIVVKRLQGTVSPQTVEIISDNPKYQPRNAELGELLILGKVIYTLNAQKVG